MTQSADLVAKITSTHGRAAGSFTDWFYPGFKAGGTIQSAFNLVHGLSGRHDFSVVTRDTDYTGAAPYEGIKSDVWIVRPNGMRVFYFSSAKLTYANLSALVKSERFDVAYINGMYSPRLSIFPLLILSRLGKKAILAPRGMLAPSSIAIKGWKEDRSSLAEEFRADEECALPRRLRS